MTTEGPGSDETSELPGSEVPEEQDTGGRNILAIILGVALVIVLGAALGFIVSGGLGDDPASSVTSTTLGTTVSSAIATTATTIPESTTLPGSASSVETSTPSTTPVPAPPLTEPEGERTLVAVEDTFIDTSDPTETNGDETVLEIENDPSPIKQALVRFDIPEIPADVTLTEATLRFTIVSPGTSAVSVHGVMGTWSEADTTAENAPLLGDPIVTLGPPEAGATFVEVDVIDVITESGPVSLYLLIDSPEQEEDVEYSSRESGSGAPALILRWES